MNGGIVVSTKKLKPQFYLDSHEGILTCSAGHPILDVCDATRLKGWDMRVVPSNCHTTSSVGGLVSSRTFGKGSLQFGSIDDPGNVLGLTILTIEQVPPPSSGPHFPRNPNSSKSPPQRPLVVFSGLVVPTVSLLRLLFL